MISSILLDTTYQVRLEYKIRQSQQLYIDNFKPNLVHTSKGGSRES